MSSETVRNITVVSKQFVSKFTRFYLHFVRVQTVLKSSFFDLLLLDSDTVVHRAVHKASF